MKSIYYQPEYQRLIIDEIKEPLNKAFGVLGDPAKGKIEKARALYWLRNIPSVVLDKLPEPTPENVGVNRNTRLLAGMYQRFFARFNVPSRVRFIRFVVKFVIIIHATDFYRPFIDWWGWEIHESDYNHPGPMQPDPHFFQKESE